MQSSSKVNLGIQALLLLIFTCSHTAFLRSQTAFTWDTGPSRDVTHAVTPVYSTVDNQTLRLESKIDIGVYHTSLFSTFKTGTSDVFILGFTSDTLVITVDADSNGVYGDPFTVNSLIIGEYGNGTSTILGIHPNGDSSKAENHVDDNGSAYQPFTPGNPANFTNITSLEIVNANASGLHFIVDNILVTIPDSNKTPIAKNDTLTTLEDNSVGLTISTDDLGYVDADGDTLSHIFIVDLPESGTLFLDTDGDQRYDQGEELAKTDQVSKAELDSGRLVFQAEDNESGQGYGAFEFVVNDGNSYSESSNLITFDVTPVNDEPSFVKGADQSILEDAGVQTVISWATSLNKGAPEEEFQELIFSLSNDNTGLFSVQPTIDSSGTLRYTPATDANGVATVTIVLSDNGDTTNGGDNTFATQTFSISITSVNDEPSFVKGTDQNVLEDAGPQVVSSWATALDKGATDESSQSLTFTLSNDYPSLFSVQPTLDSSGTLSYTPADNVHGEATITVVLTDDGGTANGGVDTYTSQTFQIRVNSVNDEPSFVKGTDQVVLEDAGPQVVASWATSLDKGAPEEHTQVLSFSLSNDDPSLFSVQPTIDSSGTLRYTPAVDANGIATVTAVLSDDGDTTNGGDNTYASQTFSITVTPVNDEPSFVKGADQTVWEDAGPQVVNAWATALNKGATNESSQSLTFTLSNNNPGLFSVQPAVDSGGTLTFTPVANVHGIAVVTVALTDDGDTTNGGDNTYASQTFQIRVNTVNDEPSFVKGIDQLVLEDAGYQEVASWATSLDKGAPEEHAQVLTFSLSNDNPSLFSVQPTIDSSGTLRYTPAVDANGLATVTVVLSDDGDTTNGGDNTFAPQTFLITVTSVNDEPSFAKGADQSIPEDVGAQVVSSWATTIYKGATDESSQSLTFSLSNDNPSLFSVQPAIDSTGTLTYTPIADAHGEAKVTVVLTDDGGIVNGGDDTYTPQSFQILVNAVNDEPSFVKGTDQTVLEDAGPQVINTWATSIHKGAINESSQALSFSLSNDNPGLFNVQPAIDSSGTLSYTPASDANGAATVTIVLSDDGDTTNGGDNTFAPQTFLITLTPVNDEPSFVKGADQTVSEDAGPQVINTWATSIHKGAINESNQALSFSLSNDNSSLFSVQPTIDSSGTLTYTPAAEVHGEATVTVVLTDDGGTENGGDDTFPQESFQITITPVNDPPSFDLIEDSDQILIEDSGPQIVTSFAVAIHPGGGADEASQTLTFHVSTNNEALFDELPQIDPVTGALSYTPAAHANGDAVVTVSLSDNAGGTERSLDQTFTIFIEPVNDAPSFVLPGNPNQVIEEDAGSQTVSGFIEEISPGGGTDEATQNLSFFVSFTNDSLFSIPPQINTSTGALTYTPAPQANGISVVTLILIDNGDGTNFSSTKSFSITVNAVNDSPLFILPDDPDQFIDEDAGDQIISQFASSIHPGGGVDESTQSLSFNITTSNDSLFDVLPTIDLSTGDLRFTPAPHINGVATIRLSLSDNGEENKTSEEQDFRIIIVPVNDEPSFSLMDSPDQLILEDAGPQLVNSFAQDIHAGGGEDETSQVLTFQVSTSADSLFKVLPDIHPISGALTYTPAEHANGSATVRLSLVDDGGGTNSSEEITFQISIQEVNDRPSFTLSERPDQFITEDAGLQSIAGFARAIHPGGGSYESFQVLSFHVSTSADSLFEVLPEIHPSSGELTYTPASDAHGTALVSATLADDGGGTDSSEAKTFIITIEEVNDAPEFTMSSDPPTIWENDGPQIVTEFITDMTPGGGQDEADQALSLSYRQTHVEGDLAFDEDPHITSTGVLTYTPATRTSGIAYYEVSLSDDGEPSATSEIKFFSIIVTPLPNTLPVMQSPLLDRVFDAGFRSISIDLKDVFIDPDEDSLTLTVSSSDTTVVKVSLNELRLVVEEVGQGSAEIFLTVDDGNGGILHHRFSFTVNMVLSSMSELADGVHIFPNPTIDRVSVTGIPFEAEAIWLTDVLGNRILSREGSVTDRWDIDMKDLAKGIYLVHIQVQGHVFSRKIIKR